MRSRSQLKLESAPEYTVSHPFTVDDRHYAVHDVVNGDVARSWPTFRTLVDVNWLLPTSTTARTYTVAHAFREGDHEYVMQEVVDGELARSWSVFHRLLAMSWLVPSSANPAQPAERTSADVKPAAAAKRR